MSDVIASLLINDYYLIFTVPYLDDVLEPNIKTYVTVDMLRSGTVHSCVCAIHWHSCTGQQHSLRQVAQVMIVRNIFDLCKENTMQACIFQTAASSLAS